MHGFLNIFVAGALAHALRLDEATLLPVLECEDGSRFRFDDEGLGWDNLSATRSQINAARRSGALSFGSCSFDEPRQDLQSLGLL
jgi:hypothetical protein